MCLWCSSFQQFKALLLHMTADSIQNSSIGSDCSGSDEAAESAFVGASDSGIKEVYSANDCPAVIAQLAFLLHNLIIEGQS